MLFEANSRGAASVARAIVSSFACALVLLIAPIAVGAQQTAPTAAPPKASSSTTGAGAPTPAFDGPPPPVPPAVLTRDDRGNATVRAVRISQPIRIDGRLDEEVYGTTEAVSGFIQQDPHEGEPSTERTDAWVFFDDENIYVSARCWDDHPERWVLSELRRDSNIISQNEHFVVVFDTFHDKRNGFFFQSTPLSAIRDQIFTDEGNANSDWNTIWYVRGGRFEGGWTVEMEIPFKSLRYREAGPQVWGINFRRVIRWKNEDTYLTRVSAAWSGNGVFHASSYGTLVGLETPTQSSNLEIKPYVASAVTTDNTAASPFSNRFTRNAGFDFKYGVTRSLIADATVNTDFAQVEEDVQQVNLTRFSLFFPEKRDFFLEGRGTFGFGTVVGGMGGGGGNSDVPTLFFSRRIGLSKGQSVPIVAGGRLSGTIGKYSIGALNIQTDDKASAGAVATNFGVLRLRRDILRRSNIGVLVTNRSRTAANDGSNQLMGVDANFAFFRYLSVNSYYARTNTLGRSGDPSSYRGIFNYASDRYGLSAEHLLVGDRFNPEVGFLRRSDFRRSTVTGRFSPRPQRNTLVRRFSWEGSYDYITNSHRTRIENRQATGTWRVEFNNSDLLAVEYSRDFEFLPKDFEIAPHVVIPTGGYNYQTLTAGYTLGTQRRVSGRLQVKTGTLYGGTKQETSFSAARAALTSRLYVEPGVTLDWVDLPQGRFTTRLFTARATFTPSPRSLASGLLQYNASDHTVSSSLRLRWEYTPGSELFVVYSDGRNTIDPDPIVGRSTRLLNRSFAVKVTRLLRF